MKKITKTFTVILIFSLTQLLTINAQTEYKLDSIQQFQYDNILDFQLTRRIHYTYENEGIRPTEILYIMKQSGTWDADYRFIYTHNSDGNYLTETHQDWDNVNMLWLNLSRGDYEYDAFQNNTVITYYTYDGSWNFSNRITSEYNANNQPTYQLFEIVFPMSTEIYKSRNYYTYDENGNNILIEQQDWNSTSGTWENIQKYVMTYNGNLIMQQDSFTWTGGFDWPTDPQSRLIYDYTSNDIYNVTTQIDSGSGLTNSSLIYYTYNSGKPIEYEFKTWVSGVWKERQKLTFSYDGNGNLSEYFQYNWDDGSNAYVYYSKNLYFWSEAQPFALGTSTKELISARLYPNPFQDEINISLKSPLESDAVIELFDLQGKEIYILELKKGMKSIKLNNTYLSKGVYFLHLNNTKTNQTFKIIKQ